MPITVISARSEDKDKIDALDAGADDYLTKPFSTEKLLARIRGIYRRIRYIENNISSEQPYFQNGSLKIDYGMQTVYVKDVEIHVTPIEYKILCNCSGQDEAFTAESVRKCSGCKNRAILNAKHCPIHRNYEGTE